MTEHSADENYQPPAGGAYTAEEHLKAQQQQVSAQTGKPLHEPGAEGVIADDDDASDSDEPASDAGSHAAHPAAEGTGETPPAKLG